MIQLFLKLYAKLVLNISSDTWHSQRWMRHVGVCSPFQYLKERGNKSFIQSCQCLIINRTTVEKTNDLVEQLRLGNRVLKNEGFSNDNLQNHYQQLVTINISLCKYKEGILKQTAIVKEKHTGTKSFDNPLAICEQEYSIMRSIIEIMLKQQEDIFIGIYLKKGRVKQNLMQYNLSAQLQMRIDFSRLDKDPKQSPLITPLSNTLHFWNTPNEQKPRPDDISQHNTPLSYSVSYPYEISRSVSPSAIKNEISYLQAKKILPASTLRFIQNTLKTEMENSEQLTPPESNKIKPVTRQLFFDHSMRVQKQNSIEDRSKINKTMIVAIDHSRRNRQKQQKKHVKPRVYDFRLKDQTRKDAQKQQNLEGVTLRPLLNYTMNSKVAKKVQNKRNHMFNNTNTNLFDFLYRDAERYSSKRSVQRLIAQQEFYCQRPRKTSRVKVATTFEQRLQKSLDREAQRKKKAQNKLQFDQSTGKKFFVPDTMISKITYYTHFKTSATINVLPQTQPLRARGLHYSKDSSKFNHSQELTTTLNNSFEKELNRSLNSREMYEEINRKPLQKVNQLAQIYAEELWREEQLNQDILDEKERRVLQIFLSQIKKYEQGYTKNASRQVFIAFFKQFYENMNLFDRDILDKRLKVVNKQKKEQRLYKLQAAKGKQNRAVKGNKKCPTSQLSLDHIHKQYFI